MAWFNQFADLFKTVGGALAGQSQGPQFSQPKPPTFRESWEQIQKQHPGDPLYQGSAPSLDWKLSNPMETGVARRATPEEIAAGGYVPPSPQANAGMAGQVMPYQPSLGPSRNADDMTFGPQQGLLPPGMGGIGIAPPQMQPQGNPSVWQESPQGMTVPNQPYRPFTGQPQAPQQSRMGGTLSSLGRPSGSSYGLRRMRAPTGEERDIPESQGPHFLKRGGRWV